jgi:hypothetical protein
MESFDINSLPLPPKTEDYDLEWTSVIFNVLKPNETFSLSKEAAIPFWLKKNMHRDLNV